MKQYWTLLLRGSGFGWTVPWGISDPICRQGFDVCATGGIKLPSRFAEATKP